MYSQHKLCCFNKYFTNSILEPESSSSCFVRLKLFSKLCDELVVHPFDEQTSATTTNETTQKYQY